MSHEAFGGEQLVKNFNDENVRVESISNAYVLIYQKKNVEL